MPILSEIDITDAPKHVLVYGPPKSGKSLLALATAEKFNVTYLGFENGGKVGKQLPLEWQKKIKLIEVPDTKFVPLAFNYLLTLFKTGKLHICTKHGFNQCKTCVVNLKPFDDIVLADLTKDDILVIDSLTQISNSIMAFLGLGKADDWVPEDWIPWRKQGTYLDMLLGFIQNAPFHVVVCSHEIATEMQSGTEKIVPIAGSQNFSRNSAKYFDTVVYCDIVNSAHVAASTSVYKNNILTGDRMNVNLQKAGKKGLLAVFDGTVDLPVVTTEVEGVPVDPNKSALADLLKKG